MNQALTTKQPTLQEQIEFVRKARREELVLKTREHVAMWREIEENLMAIELHRKTNGQALLIPQRAEFGVAMNDVNFGRTNMYVCDSGHQTVTIDRAEGTTPYLIVCPACEAKGKQETAVSMMYKVSQALVPSHEFYKPTEQELADMKAELAPNMFEDLAGHVANGGLLFRKIQEVSHA
jgi:hypothetical protein